MTRRDLAAAAVIALAVAAVLATPPFARLEGLSIDWLTALRWHVMGQRHDPRSSPAVVVALDEETYRRPPFAGTPSVTWTGEIGRVTTAIVDGGASVVGLDVIFPTSIEESQIAFEGGTLGARIRGFDREYLRAIARAAREGKLVLGQVQHGESPIVPSAAQRVAVGHGRNIRLLNFHADRDDVVRRVPLTFSVDGQPVPSMPLELAARHLRAAVGTSDGGATLAAWRVPGRIAGTMALDFEGGADDIPTYSLADLAACAQAGKADFFQRVFSGRVVLIGTVLDLEDRKLTSKRLATGREGARAERCMEGAPPQLTPVVRDTIAGVYVHATAVNNLVRQAPLREAERGATVAATAGLAGLTALSIGGMALPGGVLAAAVLAMAWTAASIAAMSGSLSLPLLEGLAAIVLAGVAALGWRFAVTDKDKRLLRRSFSLYLAPALVEKVVAARTPPQLGGETRIVTILSSDLAGFSKFSEKLAPHELVALMNTYLSEMTDVITAHGGFVDKYIGDAIFAVFGAPLDDPEHAYNAVAAALACERVLAELNARQPPELKGLTLVQRIGLHSGPALVGNIGSRQRFNYTVMGDAANLASRLEGANKAFGTRLMASGATADLVGNRVIWREVDQARVVGRAAPVRLMEPLAMVSDVDAGLRARAAAYADGLAMFRAGDFAGAAARLDAIAPQDAPAQALRTRALGFAAVPPPAGWDGINDLESK